MGVPVLILGESGHGKSTSLRNFNGDEIGIFNVASKPLPFRGNLKKVDHATYNDIEKSLMKNALRAYCIDDAGYLLSFANFARAKEVGYQKYTEMAVDFEVMLESIMATNADTITYVMMHIEYDVRGNAKPKLIGKMLDEKLCVEGLFPIVLLAKRDESGYHFITQSDGTTCAKSSMGMFEQVEIDNDLKAVDTIIREYYGLKPITDKNEEAKKEGESDAD